MGTRVGGCSPPRGLGALSCWLVFTHLPAAEPFLLPTPPHTHGSPRGRPDANPRRRDQSGSSSGILPLYQVSEMTFPLGHLWEGRKSSRLGDTRLSSAPGPQVPPGPCGQCGRRPQAGFQGVLSLPASSPGSSGFPVAVLGHCVL